MQLEPWRYSTDTFGVGVWIACRDKHNRLHSMLRVMQLSKIEWGWGCLQPKASFAAAVHSMALMGGSSRVGMGMAAVVSG